MIDFLFSAWRNGSAAQRFFRKVPRQPHTVNARTITVDKNPAYPRVVSDLKQAGGPWRFSRLRHRKYLDSIVEQDHRRIKRSVRPGLGFGDLRTARRTLAGYEAMATDRTAKIRAGRGACLRCLRSMVALRREGAIPPGILVDQLPHDVRA